MRLIPTLSAVISMLLLATSVAVGQGKVTKPGDAQRLESLLKELDGVDAKAWQQRLKVLRDQASSHKAQAKNLQRASEENLRRAQTIEREIQRLERLQKFFLAGKPSAKPASKPPAKKPVAKPKPKAPAKKPVAKPKPAAKKSVAKPKPKVPAKKPVAKPKPKAPAKKPVAKPKPKAPAKKPVAKPKPKAPAKKPVAKPKPKAPAKKPVAKPKSAAKKSMATPKPKAPAKQTAPSTDNQPMSASPSPALITYEDHVQEIFMDNCAGCHDADQRKGGLDLTSFASARSGGASGTTIIPGDVERSRLYLLVSHQEKPTMPPDEPKIAAAKIELIQQWIAAGAPETSADARSFAAKRMKATKTVVARTPRFDQPAPLPTAWATVEPSQLVRPVTVTSLATSGRSPLVAVPGLHQIFVLDSTTRKVLGILPFTHGDVEVMNFSADCSQLMVGGGLRGKRGRVSLFDVANGSLLGTYGKEYDSVLAAAIHPQLTQIALGGPKKRVRVFDVATGDQAYEIRSHNDWILGVDFSPNGRFLASGSRDGSIAVTRTQDGRNLHTIQRNRGAVQQVRFTPDSTGLLAIGDDGTLRKFELKEGNQVWQRNTGTQPKALAISFDGKMLACGGSDGRPRLFQSNGSPLTTLPSVNDWIYSVAFDKDGKFLFVGSWQGVTSVFDTKTRKRIATVTPSMPVTIGKPSGQ